METSKTIWDYLIKKGFSKAGAAGAIGNMDCESGLNSINLENTGNLKLNITDNEYMN